MQTIQWGYYFENCGFSVNDYWKVTHTDQEGEH